MRLKIFFFPLMVVVALAILLLKVWPQRQIFSSLRSGNAAKQEDLANSRLRNENVGKLAQDLDVNLSKKNLVFEYLPKVKYEERAIAAMDYLARSLNLSLVDLTVRSGSNPEIKPEELVANKTVTIATNKTATTAKEIKLGSFTLGAMVVGEYAKLKEFVDSVQALNMESEINSLKISKQVKQPQGVGENAVPENDNLLNLELAVDFKYYPSFTGGQEISKKILASDKFSYAAYEALSKKASQADKFGEAVTGRANPFLP